MTRYDHAIALAEQGFYVFPLQPNGKKPTKGMRFKEFATRDREQIAAWWLDNPELNIGIYTGRFGDDEALLVVDVDNKQTKKGAKNGDQELVRLELAGFDLPDTRVHRTPTGGRHLIFRVASAVRQGANVLAQGLDVRSRGGYVVGPGSSVRHGTYGATEGDIADAPVWVVQRCGDGVQRRDRDDRVPGVVNADRAVARAISYLEGNAASAVEGDAGDERTYKVAARLKDLGCTRDQAFELMVKHWNERCQPPWSLDELRQKVDNAYHYGTEAPGAAAPEADFSAVISAPDAEKLHPYDELNRSYAVVDVGGSVRILHETCDEEGAPRINFLSQTDFRLKHLSKSSLDPKAHGKCIGDDWLEWHARRSYEGVCFRPEQPAPTGWYNLWTGFSVEPAPATTAAARGALDAFLEHIAKNVCNGNAALTTWLLAYFAHLIRRPWEKPLVALVLRGAKGVGKNVCIERIGALLGKHFLVVDDPRYLLGNFNDHLANMLFMALDEAAWAGDKKAEGRLKGLITGSRHVIEPKGLKHFTTRNLTRVAILGNEDWLAPSSHDERRFAVFDVGDGRKQDLDFFENMRLGMEAGGYGALLHYLQQFETPENVHVNRAPATKALLDQKHRSLDPTYQWWLACLCEGRIASSDFGDDWPANVSRERFRDALGRYVKARQIKSRIPDSREIGKLVRKVAPSLGDGRSRTDGYTYKFPTLDVARREWEAFIGHDEDWT